MLRARVGLHLGEAEERGGDYFGPVVNACARAEAAGHGGQAIMSDAVRSVIAHVDGPRRGPLPRLRRRVERGVSTTHSGSNVRRQTQQILLFVAGVEQPAPPGGEAIAGGDWTSYAASTARPPASS